MRGAGLLEEVAQATAAVDVALQRHPARELQACGVVIAGELLAQLGRAVAHDLGVGLLGRGEIGGGVLVRVARGAGAGGHRVPALLGARELAAQRGAVVGVIAGEVAVDRLRADHLALGDEHVEPRAGGVGPQLAPQRVGALGLGLGGLDPPAGVDAGLLVIAHRHLPGVGAGRRWGRRPRAGGRRRRLGQLGETRSGGGELGARGRQICLVLAIDRGALDGRHGLPVGLRNDQRLLGASGDPQQQPQTKS
jgi:hypothetical protein